MAIRRSSNIICFFRRSTYASHPTSQQKKPVAQMITIRQVVAIV
jgi:hypothetical protein